ncbi:MAG: hypothetical protein K5836_01390 [Clostridiales bacterium]|nr:hypothetical protein [Clostridiales bacterium]
MALGKFRKPGLVWSLTIIMALLLVTANAFDEDVELSVRAGLNAHLSKPVEPVNLFETLETFIKA